jgi:protein-tyrosine phosphatase
MSTNQPSPNPQEPFPDDDNEARFTSISRILPNLYLGNRPASYHLPTLTSHSITAIVSLLETPHPRWSHPDFRALIPETNHLIIPVADNEIQDLLVHLPPICDFIDAQHEAGRNVLVHCIAGASRSPTVVVGWLMRKWGRGREKALRYVKGKRRETKPSGNFMGQLVVWEECGFEVWEDEEGRVERGAYARWLRGRDAEVRQGKRG